MSEQKKRVLDSLDAAFASSSSSKSRRVRTSKVQALSKTKRVVEKPTFEPKKRIKMGLKDRLNCPMTPQELSVALKDKLKVTESFKKERERQIALTELMYGLLPLTKHKDAAIGQGIKNRILQLENTFKKQSKKPKAVKRSRRTVAPQMATTYDEAVVLNQGWRQYMKALYETFGPDDTVSQLLRVIDFNGSQVTGRW